MSVANNGPCAAGDVLMQSSLPDGLLPVSVNVSDGVAYSVVSSALLCTVPILIAARSASARFFVNVLSDAPGGNAEIVANVTSNSSTLLTANLTQLTSTIPIVIGSDYGTFATTGTTIIAIATSLIGLLGLLAFVLIVLMVYFYKRKAKILARREATEDVPLNKAFGSSSVPLNAPTAKSESRDLDFVVHDVATTKPEVNEVVAVTPPPTFGFCVACGTPKAEEHLVFCINCGNKF
jgi:hypothetical protein